MMSSRLCINTLRSVTSTAVVVSFLVLYSQSKEIKKRDPISPLPPTHIPMGVYEDEAVVSKGAPCAHIGVKVLSKGGNAVDAAIATMLCVGVVCPEYMGLGGGFMMSYYDAGTKKVMKINAREMAPDAATENMFVEDQGKSLNGGLAIAIPGQLKGYWTIYDKFGGKVPWESLFEPTIQLLEEGIEISERLGINLNKNKKMIQNNPLLKETFFDKKYGRLKKKGETYTLPLLANTMKTIANEGADAFYNGSLTPKLLEDLKSIGGIITAEDLKNYTVEVEAAKPIKLKRGLTLHVGPPPESSTILAYILRILDDLIPSSSVEPASNAEPTSRAGVDQSSRQTTRDVNDQKSCIPILRSRIFRTKARCNRTKKAITRRNRPTSNELDAQRIVEAYKFAYGLKSRLGDHKFVNITDEIYDMIRSDNHIDEVREKISDSSTFQNPRYYGAYFDNIEDYGTDNIVVMDKSGNVVVATSSLNTHFGSGYMSLSTGIFLNNQMGDFSTPGSANNYELWPSPANFIEPRKRPMTSMCPSIFTDENGDFVLGVGGTGGSRITLAVAYVSIHYLWYNVTLKKAVDKPRFFHKLMPMEVEYEYGVTRDIVHRLKRIGHKMFRIPAFSLSGASSTVTAIAKSLGKIYAMPDFRAEEFSAGN